MSKVIALFGAGSGLGTAVARRFGQEGYSVALVARRRGPLDALASTLRSEGIKTTVFPADLSHPDAVADLISEIRHKLGHIDGVCYSPATTEAFLPASEMTVTMMRERTELLFHGLVAVVNEVLPEMRKRGSGAILAGFGGTAALGLPYMSGPAPAQAAARNYLFSLHGEVADLGIHVGIVTISGVITGSGYHHTIVAEEHDAPADLSIPIVEAADLANQLWQTANGLGKLEVAFPAV